MQHFCYKWINGGFFCTSHFMGRILLYKINTIKKQTIFACCSTAVNLLILHTSASFYLQLLWWRQKSIGLKPEGGNAVSSCITCRLKEQRPLDWQEGATFYHVLTQGSLDGRAGPGGKLGGILTGGNWCKGHWWRTCIATYWYWSPLACPTLRRCNKEMKYLPAL